MLWAVTQGSVKRLTFSFHTLFPKNGRLLIRFRETRPTSSDQSPTSRYCSEPFCLSLIILCPPTSEFDSFHVFQASEFSSGGIHAVLRCLACAVAVLHRG